MKKSKFIIFLTVVVIPMVSCQLYHGRNQSTAFPLIEHSKLDRVDENIFQETPSSLLTMKTIKTISQLILNILNNVNKSSSFETSEKMISEMNSIINKLNKTGINLYEESNILYPAYILKIREDLKALSTIINDIDYLFENYYLEYLNGHISNTSLQIFISKAIGVDADSPGKSAFTLQKIVYSKADGTSDSGLLKEIVDKVNKEDSLFCSIRQTPQQFMYNLYNSLATAEFKAFIMVLSAYKLHAVASNDDYIKDSKRVQAEHLERVKNYLTIFGNILHKSSTEIRACSGEPKDKNSADQILAINKLPKESDYRNNKVVTGVRFIIKDQVLHVQIEEGELIANGKILPDSDKWLPIDDIDYDSRTVNRSGQVIRMRQCVDYHSVTSSDYWYLKNVMAPPNSVVIGANLEVYGSESESNKVIYLRLKFAKVNIKTAQLDTSQEQYSDGFNKFPPELRDEYLADNTKYVYLKEKEKLVYLENRGNTYINVIPFIDSQAIYGNPRLPLMGIGTFNKNSSTNNIILLKVFALDFSLLVDIN